LCFGHHCACSVRAGRGGVNFGCIAFGVQLEVGDAKSKAAAQPHALPRPRGLGKWLVRATMLCVR
jgi:hypothetical protein